MSAPQPTNYAFGMIGLGTMGRNLLLNMADHGFSVAGYDKDTDKIPLLQKEAGEDNLHRVEGFTDLKAFVQSLAQPRAIMMLVPAGKIVDSVITEITPLLAQGDILIDGGNSYFLDTTRRAKELEEKGLHFFGMGISGGEEGARRGPSMMPGGDQDAYQKMKPVLEAVAAKVGGEPCVTYIGPGAAGHFVKMVHNGIEYGIMQLLAETYDIMKNGLGMDDEAMQQVYAKWNEGRLQSFLVDITKDIFAYIAPDTDHLLLDDIKDEARAKGTGKWTSQIAMDLEVPLSLIDEAVAMRDLSKYKSLREQMQQAYPPRPTPSPDEREQQLQELEQALYFGMIVAYAQGMHMLARASQVYEYNLNLAGIARIWRGGCIIRSGFLNTIYNAYQRKPDLAHLLLDEEVRQQVQDSVGGARAVVARAATGGIGTAALAASLSYFDTLRTGRMPSNLIQAQRDYFGAHTYELIGQEGVFHTQWTPAHEEAENKQDTHRGTGTENETPVKPNK